MLCHVMICYVVLHLHVDTCCLCVQVFTWICVSVWLDRCIDVRMYVCVCYVATRDTFERCAVFMYSHVCTSASRWLQYCVTCQLDAVLVARNFSLFSVSSPRQRRADSEGCKGPAWDVRVKDPAHLKPWSLNPSPINPKPGTLSLKS